METKPAIQSTELWIVFVNILVFAGLELFTDPAFIEFGREHIPQFEILSMAVLGFLRLYKTKTKIKGVFKQEKTDENREENKDFWEWI